MNNNNEYAAGFAWRHSDRTTSRGNWLRDLAIALAVALAATLLFMAGDAYAQDRVIQIAGNTHTAMVTVTLGKSQDVRTGSSFVDVMVGDPDVADVNPLTDHTLSILGKKIGTTRVQVYAEGKKLIGIFDVEVTYDITPAGQRAQAALPRLASASVLGQRPHHAVGRGDRCRHPRQGGDHRAPVRPRYHQHGVGDVAAASDAGSALHRDLAQRQPRTGRAVEPLRQPQHRQYRRRASRRPCRSVAGGAKRPPACSRARRRSAS